MVPPLFPVRARSALTILELLIAVALFAVLSILLLTATQKIRESSRSAGCLHNLKQIGVAANLYFADHRNQIPLQPNTNPTGWQHVLAPYLDLIPNESTAAPVFLCPSQASSRSTQPRSYRWNLSRNKPGESMATGSTTILQIPASRRNRLTLFAEPSRHAMVFDIIYTGPARFDLWKNNNNTWGNTYDLNSYPPDQPGEYPRPHYHNRAVNILYYDGRVAPAHYPLPHDTYYWDPES